MLCCFVILTTFPDSLLLLELLQPMPLSIAFSCCFHQHSCSSMQVKGHTFDSEAVSQLTLGDWPLLEVLMVGVEYLDKQVVSTLTQGHWPMLKELHVINKDSELRYQSWDFGRQAIEEECKSVCRNRWPDVQFHGSELAYDQNVKHLAKYRQRLGQH